VTFTFTFILLFSMFNALYLYFRSIQSMNAMPQVAVL
jgi:hypothetical protein